MTFGYNANFFSDCAEGRINVFAQNLYSELEVERHGLLVRNILLQSFAG